MTESQRVLQQIKGKLVVSCQALPHEPLHSSYIMSRMAVAAMQGGAAGIRAQSVSDINAIAEVCHLPIIGIVKRNYDDSEIYITPTMKEIEELLTTRAEIIAMDATCRKRPDGILTKELIDRVHEAGRLAMADCSTFEECLAAQEIGFDIVSTTMSGYTEYSAHLDGPNFELIRKCAAQLAVPVIAEGKIHYPEDLRKVFECGAFSAVVGGAITRPQEITARFVNYIVKDSDEDLPLMPEKQAGHVSLKTKANETIARSLECFDNNDPRIPHYELLLEQSLDEIKEIELPPAYHYENYAPGDREVWIAIEKSAKEFASYEAGEAAWSKYFAGHEEDLKNRMFFVTDSSGRKLATATAYYNIYTGDDGKTGWLHWVAVHRDAQGQKLSKPLITHVLAHMKKLGYSRAVIPTQTNTWLACKLYLDLGFVPIKENAERNRVGWCIVKTLTNHPALDGFETVTL
jgi:N-acylglucosamine-6-phosphate 2-epimerase